MKKVEAYRLGQDIPSRGVFLFWRDLYMPGDSLPQTFFFYEIPSKCESEKAANDDHSESIDSIIIYLNEAIGGGKFSKKTKATRDKIRKWLRGGKTVDDFKTVIDKKCDDWLDNPKMRPYLRPETLFGGKFEGYLNETPADEIAQRPFDELDKLMDDIE